MSGIYFKELWGEIATIKGKHDGVWGHDRINLYLYCGGAIHEISRHFVLSKTSMETFGLCQPMCHDQLGYRGKRVITGDTTTTLLLDQ